MFKLISDGSNDYPVLACDVCGKLVDIFSDLASSSAGTFDAPAEVSIHHKKCAVTGKPLHLPINEFLALFLIKSRAGDVSSDKVSEKVFISSPAGKRFES